MTAFIESQNGTLIIDGLDTKTRGHIAQDVVVENTPYLELLKVEIVNIKDGPPQVTLEMIYDTEYLHNQDEDLMPKSLRVSIQNGKTYWSVIRCEYDEGGGDYIETQENATPATIIKQVEWYNKYVDDAGALQHTVETQVIPLMKLITKINEQSVKPSTVGGDHVSHVHILGRRRRVIVKGGRECVRYLGEMITLNKAKKLDLKHV